MGMEKPAAAPARCWLPCSAGLAPRLASRNISGSLLRIRSRENGACDGDRAFDFRALAAARRDGLEGAAGVNLAPSGFECAFTSFAHTDDDLKKALEAARKVQL